MALAALEVVVAVGALRIFIANFRHVIFSWSPDWDEFKVSEVTQKFFGCSDCDGQLLR